MLVLHVPCSTVSTSLSTNRRYDWFVMVDRCEQRMLLLEDVDSRWECPGRCLVFPRRSSRGRRYWIVPIFSIVHRSMTSVVDRCLHSPREGGNRTIEHALNILAPKRSLLISWQHRTVATISVRFPSRLPTDSIRVDFLIEEPDRTCVRNRESPRELVDGSPSGERERDAIHH